MSSKDGAKLNRKKKKNEIQKQRLYCKIIFSQFSTEEEYEEYKKITDRKSKVAYPPNHGLEEPETLDGYIKAKSELICCPSLTESEYIQAVEILSRGVTQFENGSVSSNPFNNDNLPYYVDLNVFFNDYRDIRFGEDKFGNIKRYYVNHQKMQNPEEGKQKNSEDILEKLERETFTVTKKLIDMINEEVAKVLDKVYNRFNLDLVDKVCFFLEGLLPFNSFMNKVAQQLLRRNEKFEIGYIYLLEPKRTLEFKLERISMDETTKIEDVIGYTEGRLFVKGMYNNNFSYLCDSLERPYLNNANNISSIPEGKYPLRYHPYTDTSANFKGAFYKYRFDAYDDNERDKGFVPWLLNTGVREGILIHEGYIAKNSEGCILIGQKLQNGYLYNDSKPNKNNSWPTFLKFMHYFRPAVDNKFEIELTIEKKYPDSTQN